MLPLSLAANIGDRPTLLCLGAHSDDIEIGAGATVLAICEALPAARICWVVFAGHGDREAEARRSAEFFCEGYADVKVIVHAFRDGYFPQHTTEIKEEFESLKADWNPDIVLTHYREDRHQDHRTISDLTWQTFRNHLVLEYEIPKYDGDFGVPNLFVPVAEVSRHRKTAALERFFGSQGVKGWFSRETFDATMRLRGIECNSPTGYAEAFYCRKAILKP